MGRRRDPRPLTPTAVGRLALYRRVLQGMAALGATTVHSRDIGDQAGTTASMVRQDLMRVGCQGRPQHGYDLADLDAAIVRSLLNLSGASLRLPAGTYVENHDLGLALGRAAFFARPRAEVTS